MSLHLDDATVAEPAAALRDKHTDAVIREAIRDAVRQHLGAVLTDVSDAEGLRPIAVGIKTAIAISGLNRAKLYEEWRAGRLVFHKHGGKTIVLYSSLEQLVRNLPRALPLHARGADPPA